MLISALLVALIATLSQWWVSHAITRTWLYPIWSGFLVALAMGDPIVGMQAAAFIQLTYLGWITAGGTMPGNLMAAGVFGTALTLVSGAAPELAPTFAVPFSLLGIFINQAYMTINSFWLHRADKYLEQGNIRKMRLMNYVPSGILSFVLYGVPAFLLVYVGGGFAQRALAALPVSVTEALTVVGALMPALGIAMLLNYLGSLRLFGFFILGFFGSIYLNLDIMATTVFAGVIALSLYMFSNKNKASSGEVS